MYRIYFSPTSLVALVTLIASLGGGTLGCSGEAQDLSFTPTQSAIRSSEPTPASRKGSPAAPRPISYGFDIPEGLTPMDIPVLVKEKVHLGHEAQVQGSTGKPGLIVNAGRGMTILHQKAQAGDLLSVGDVRLDPRARAHDVTSSGKVDAKHALVTGAIRTRTPIDLKATTRTVEVPRDFARGVSCHGRVTRLLPGAYESIAARAGCEFQLSTGTYFVKDAELKKESALLVDDSAGPVQLIVKDQLRFSAEVRHPLQQFPEFTVTYLGSKQAHLETPFVGRLEAPFAELALHGPGTHLGSFAAKKVDVHAKAVVRHYRNAYLIKRIDVSNATPCAGEPVEVSVLRNEELDGSEPIEVSINGAPLDHSYLVFSGEPGPRRITVTASAGGFVESLSRVVVVQACTAEQPSLEASPDLNDERIWHFWLEDLRPGVDRTFTWDFGDGQTETTTVPASTHNYRSSVRVDRAQTTFNLTVTVHQASGDITIPRVVSIGSIYAYNRKLGLITPPATSLRFEAGETVWDAEYLIENPEAESVTLVPHLVDYHPCDNNRRAESQALGGAPTLTIPAGGQVSGVLALPPARDRAGTCRVTVQLEGTSASGKTTRTLLTYRPKFARPPAMSMTDPEVLTLLNLAASSGVFPNPDLVTEEQLGQLEREGRLPLPLSGGGPVSARLSAQSIELGEECLPGEPEVDGFFCGATEQWEVVPGEIANAQKGDIILSPSCEGIIGTLLFALNPKQRNSHTGIMADDRHTIFHATTPKDRPEAYPNDGEVLPLDGFEEQVFRFGWPGNVSQSAFSALWGEYRTDPLGKAFKIEAFQRRAKDCSADGQVHLEPPSVVKPPPADDSTVRPLLHRIADEAMSLAHQGHYRNFAYTDATIAVRDEYRVTGPLEPHSAWAEGTIPVVCSTLLWAAAHRVQQAGGDFVLEGKGLQDTELEPRDRVVRGSGVRQGSEDGLYFYPEEERRAAGSVFYSYLYNKVAKRGCSAWLAGNCVGDIADDIATQATMCFAYDKCSEKDKDARVTICPAAQGRGNSCVTHKPWELDAGEGNTVSPDNLLLWDEPVTGGVYGFRERMIYVGSQFRRKFVWTPKGGVADLTVKILNEANGTVIAGATVHVGGGLSGGGHSGTSDANGEVRFENLPADSGGTLYPIEAGFVLVEGAGPFDDSYLKGNAERVLLPGASEQVTIELNDGEPAFRKVQLAGKLDLYDDDAGDPDCAVPFHDCDEKDSLDVAFEFELNPVNPTYSITANPGDWCLDNELQARLEASFQLVTQDDVDKGSIEFAGGALAVDPSHLYAVVGHVKSRAWEWDECTTTSADHEIGSDDTTFLVSRDASQPLEILKSTHHEDSYARFTLTLDNRLAEGTNPLPPPGDDPNVDPKFRRIDVSAKGYVVDHDTVSPNDTGSPSVELTIDVNPWNRIASASERTCVDNEVVGELAPEVQLLDDLQTVRVNLSALVREGMDCSSGRKECGKSTVSVDVPAGATVELSAPVRATCYWLPYLAPENDTYAEYKQFVITNRQGPSP